MTGPTLVRGVGAEVSVLCPQRAASGASYAPGVAIGRSVSKEGQRYVEAELGIYSAGHNANAGMVIGGGVARDESGFVGPQVTAGFQFWLLPMLILRYGKPDRESGASVSVGAMIKVPITCLITNSWCVER